MAGHRDENGRFVKGWAGGPGRPPRNVEEQYVGSLNAKVPPSVLEDMLGVVVDQALKGCRSSQALIMRYVLPDPEKTRQAMAAETAVCRVAGAASREAFQQEMVEKMLQLAQERREQYLAAAAAAGNGNGNRTDG